MFPESPNAFICKHIQCTYWLIILSAVTFNAQTDYFIYSHIQCTNRLFSDRDHFPPLTTTIKSTPLCCLCNNAKNNVKTVQPINSLNLQRDSGGGSSHLRPSLDCLKMWVRPHVPSSSDSISFPQKMTSGMGSPDRHVSNIRHPPSKTLH